MANRVICIMARILDQEDGLGVYGRNLIEELLRLDETTRYLILLRTPKHTHTFDHFPNADTRVISGRIKTFWDQVAVPLAAWREGADLIFNPKFSLPLLSWHPGIFILHGSDWYVNPQNYRWWDNLYIRTMMPLYCRKAHHLLAISQTVIDDLSLHMGLDASKTTVSYAAPSPNFMPTQDLDALRRFRQVYDLPERFILTVARAYHTGHARMPTYPGGNNERLVRGFQQYRSEGGALPLVVAGERIEPYLRDQGFTDAELRNIHFTGYIPHDKIHMAYQLADFFILATLNESFALPLVEAMACGCPAIVPSTGACPETGGDAVQLIDPFDSADIAAAIGELAGSPERRQKLRSASLARVQCFTWQATAKRTLEAFDAVVPRSLSRSSVPEPVR